MAGARRLQRHANRSATGRPKIEPPTVLCLGPCQKGSRKQAYKVELRAARHDGRLKSQPETVYNAIVARLQEFKEGLLEWNALSRGKKTALEFLPVFESIVSEMEMAGMGKSDRDLLLGYLASIPPSNHSEVLKDRRSYQQADGSHVTRGVESGG